MLKQEGTVKRCDLNLRIKYLGLETEIYQLDTFQFVIVCNNYKESLEELSKDFNYTIRHVGTNISLVDKKPQQYLKKIENISFDNVVDDFKATCLTMNDLNNFVKLKFYNIEIIQISIPNTGVDFEILIEVSTETADTQIEIMRAALLGADLGTDKITIKKSNKIAFQEDNSKDKRIDVMLLKPYESLPFTINEGVFWLDNAERIYTGDFERSELIFFRPNTTKFYFDFSFFYNINIISALLLYDTVYITPPLCDKMEVFLTKQSITREELIKLIEMGKVVLLLSNDEIRYDKKLVSEVYKSSPSGIVGRRGINTLLASYLAETAKKYETLHPNIYNIASEIFMTGTKDNNAKIQAMAKFIAWPKLALIKSFSEFNFSSPMSICRFGINDVLNENMLPVMNDQNISFEFIVNSLNTHIATSLQATYFPFRQVEKSGAIYSDSAVSKIMGDILNLYSYDADSLKNINNIYTQGKNDYISLFDCRENISVLKVAETADEFETHNRFRDILFRLGNLSDEERTKTIREYNDILFELVGNKKRCGFTKFLMGGTGFLPLSTAFSHILTSAGLLKDLIDETGAKKKYDDYKKIEKQMIEYGISVEHQKVEDIYLLDKISRVATLR